ncbi:MAG: hypothetical protein QM579_08055 [Desulfovibrio sp.]|uniref:hypothetical protein n=1 Tax=Desulfovibrio sp. TaxID=885 RepID=UPI0039E45CB7
MATAKYVWPDWMPPPEKDGYNLQPVDRRTKTEMEIGGIVRAEYDTDEATCQCRLTLSEMESAWFEAFEANLLKQGTIWIDMPLWSAGQVTRHVVRFKDRPKITGFVGLHTVYDFALDVSGRNLWSADVVEFLALYSPDAAVLWSDALHPVLHIQAVGVTALPDNLPWGG